MAGSETLAQIAPGSAATLHSGPVAPIVNLPSVADTPKAHSPANLQCDRGPVSKTFGNAQWLVYGCSDAKTIVIFPAEGNPARSAYFTFSTGDTGYQLHEEGDAAQATTSQAHAALAALNENDIKTLLAQTGH